MPMLCIVLKENPHASFRLRHIGNDTLEEALMLFKDFPYLFSIKPFITFLFFPEEYSIKTAGNATCNFSFRTFDLCLPRYAARHQFPDTVKKPLTPPCLPLLQE